MADSGREDEPQGYRHQAAADRFFALAPQARYDKMAVPLGNPNHLEDEIVVTAARRAEAEGWPDRRKYSQELLRRIYIHVTGHVKKNAGWRKLKGGVDAAIDDFSQFAAEKLAAETAPLCHAEVAFGDYIYKRCIDAARELFFAKKNLAAESIDEDRVTESEADDANSAANASVLEELIAREDEHERDALLAKVLECLWDEEGFLTDKERMVLTYRYLGGLPVDSNDTSELTVCKLMGCKARSVRNYQASAIEKIKERLK
jgi:DNA-directed RNA polymerase specialized sigma24 family protein